MGAEMHCQNCGAYLWGRRRGSRTLGIPWPVAMGAFLAAIVLVVIVATSVYSTIRTPSAGDKCAGLSHSQLKAWIDQQGPSPSGQNSDDVANALEADCTSAASTGVDARLDTYALLQADSEALHSETQRRGGN